MPHRILVIDDTQEILDLFRDILEPEGYKVMLAKQTFESVTEIEHVHPDLIVLDLMIGAQKEGWQMLQKLKMYAPTASIPILNAQQHSTKSANSRSIYKRKVFRSSSSRSI